jgi:anti-sigma28 factor (negative regulator of flagellin synthesis)
MKINNHGQPSPIQTLRVDDAHVTRSGIGSNSGEERSAIIKGHVPKLPQLTLNTLAGQLKSEAGVRGDIVEAIKSKIQSGEYLNASSDEDTARGILGL